MKPERSSSSSLVRGRYLSACSRSDPAARVTVVCRVVLYGRGQYAPLLASCEWFVNWYQAADNPNLRYRKVACPQALHERAGTGSFATAG